MEKKTFVKNQRFSKELAVFKSTKDKTNNISKLYEALKSVKRKKKIAKVAHIIHMKPVKIVD